MSLVEPVFLNLQLFAAAVNCQARELVTLGKTLGKARMQLGRNLAAPPLWAQDASDRYESVSYSTISN